MKHISSGIKIGILVLAVLIVGYITWKAVGESAAGSGGFRLDARFKDAQGLASKSRVVIAGLPIGEIVGRKLEGRLAKISVREVMTTHVFTILPTAPVREAVAVMLAKRIGCLPVVRDGKLVGLLSESDCLRYLARLLDIADEKQQLPELVRG